MNIAERGRGPTVMLLGAAAGPAWAWTSLCESLASTRRVLMDDLPYYGREPGEGRVAHAETTRRLEDALVRRGVRELAIVGWSLGAYRALALASSTRVRVTRIVSLGGLAWLPSELRQLHGQFAAGIRAGAWPSLRSTYVEMMLGEGYRRASPDVAEMLGDWPAGVLTPLADELDANIELEDLRPMLSALRVPVLARVGALDASVPKAFSEEIAALVPHGRLELVPQCGHTLLLEDEAATFASIRCFLDEES